MKIRFAPLALALAVCASTAHAQAFNQVVIFGDSLSDMGRFKALNPVMAGLGAQDSFTTNPNPTWAGVLANSYGKTAQAYTETNKTGTNYAVGGARTDTDNPMAFTTIPSVRTQLDTYLSHTPKADPNTLYAVWIGANDLMGASGKPASEALSIITTASAKTAESVARLQQAGANYILVPNLPDVGLTAGYANTPNASTATQGAKIYNATLFRNLTNLNANIIPANTFALLGEAVADYKGFGFKYANGSDETACVGVLNSAFCAEDDWQSSTANEDYIFADDIHPSGRTHRILAQYYRSLIDAPTQMAQVAGVLTQTGKATTQRLDRKLASLNNHSQSVWADVSVSRDKGDVMDKGDVLIGFDTATPNQHTGLYVNVGENEHQLSNLLTAKVKETGAGVYHRHQFGAVGVSANAGIDKLTLDTKRQVDWEGASRTHSGEATGTRYRADLTASYGIGVGKATIRPLVGITAQKVVMNDVIENNPSQSTALQVTLPKNDSLTAKAGVALDVAVNDKIAIQGGITHYKELKDNDNQTVGAKLSSLSDYGRHYTLPVSLNKENATTANLGASFDFGKGVVNAGLTANRTDETEMGAYVGVQVGF